MRCYLDDPRLSTLGKRKMECPFQKVGRYFAFDGVGYVGSVPEIMQKLKVAGLKSLSLVIISPLKEAQLIHSSKTFVAEKFNIKDTVS